MHHQVREPLAGHGEADALQPVAQLRPRQVLAIPQRAFDDANPAGECSSVQLEPAIIRSQNPMHAWRREGQEPPNIGRCHEVPGRPHHVRPQNPTLLECALDLGV